MGKQNKMPNMTEWRKKRYAQFNAKIDALKDHPKYEWLRKYANDAMVWNEGYGFLMVKGEDFIKRIETMEVAFIRDWLDGKNKLKWDEYQVWQNVQQESVVSESAEKTGPIYVAIFNSYENSTERLNSYSKRLEANFSKECSVSLVNGDTLCFCGLTGQEMSDLMEATGADYNYSYDSPEAAWFTDEGNVKTSLDDTVREASSRVSKTSLERDISVFKVER